MMSVALHTLGCKLNFAETSTIAREFERRAFEVVPFTKAADVVVINSCSVTSEADRKCRQAVRRAQRHSPRGCIIVTGCYAQLKPEEIAAIPGVDYVLGNAEKFRLFDVVETFRKRERTQVEVSCTDELRDFAPAHSDGERTRAFLKVQDGCDYSCSFCTIPLARGSSRSHRLDAVVAEAHSLAERGYREIVLSGVNIGLYGDEAGNDLLALLRALDGVDGISRYRISSIEPNLLTNAIVDFVGASERFQPHFHVPLQSGDDHVLGRMRRRYRRDDYRDRIEYVKSIIPDACIGVDVIVGFPAEQVAQFESSFAFLADLSVEYLHVFTYSERDDTAATKNPKNLGEERVPVQERRRRNRKLRMLSEKKRTAFYSRFHGALRPVLWEAAGEAGSMYGFTDNYIRVQRRADPSREGTIETVALGSLRADGALEAGDPSLPILSAAALRGCRSTATGRDSASRRVY